MRKRNTRSGLIFFAAGAVYFGQASVVGQEVPNDRRDSSDVKVLSDDDGAGQMAAPTLPPMTGLPATGKSPRVAMNDIGTFSIQISKDSDVIELLRQIGNQAQISIIPSKGVNGTVPAMDLYNVTVHEALDAILHSAGMGWRQEGNFIYVYTDRELAELKKASHVTTTEIFHLYYTPAANAANLIKPVLSSAGQVSFTTPALSGIASNDSDAGGDNHAGDDLIVVTDYPENLKLVEKVIKEVDKRPQQILIEATILQASLTDDNALGIDFSFMGGVNFDTLLSNGLGVGSALSGSVLSASSGGTSSSSSGTSGTTGTGTTGTSSTNAAPLVRSGYAGFTTGNYDQQVPAGGLQIGIVKNNLGVFLSALESVTDTVVLANPKVLALDKQRGEVIVGRQDGYLTTTTTTTTTEQSVEFLETGTRLLFRPYIGDDGYIRMEIHPEDSSGGLTAANLPYKVTTEVTSNVMLKDGNTIVIGGLFREATQTSRSQVPFLGNLPLAGALFRNQSDSTQRVEIIILLTPHIIKDDQSYSQESEEQLKEAEKLRVGVRKGMMWFGRERLAESCYEDAQNELKKPQPNVQKAIWHLNCALDLNPQFTEAIDLKEKLTGQAVTETDSSSVRAFVERQILAERRTLVPTTQFSTLLPPGIAIDLGPANARRSLGRAAIRHGRRMMGAAPPGEGFSPALAAAPATEPSAVAGRVPTTLPSVVEVEAATTAPSAVAIGAPATASSGSGAQAHAIIASPAAPAPATDTHPSLSQTPVTAVPVPAVTTQTNVPPITTATQPSVTTGMPTPSGVPLGSTTLPSGTASTPGVPTTVPSATAAVPTASAVIPSTSAVMSSIAAAMPSTRPAMLQMPPTTQPEGQALNPIEVLTDDDAPATQPAPADAKGMADLRTAATGDVVSTGR